MLKGVFIFEFEGRQDNPYNSAKECGSLSQFLSRDDKFSRLLWGRIDNASV